MIPMVVFFSCLVFVCSLPVYPNILLGLGIIVIRDSDDVTLFARKLGLCTNAYTHTHTKENNHNNKTFHSILVVVRVADWNQICFWIEFCCSIG